MTSVASRCKSVACNAHPPLALHPVAHPFRGATENATQQGQASSGQGGDNLVAGTTPRPSCNGHAKPARIPLGSFYAGADCYRRRYLSRRLSLMKLMLFETTEVSKGD